MSTIALIPAAGYGTRFHEGGPKALVPLAGRSLVLHALERLAASGRVERAVVAIPDGSEEAFRAVMALSPLPWTLVTGGITRSDSVLSALEASGALADDLVAIHDAARPLVDPDDVRAVIDIAAETGAAIAAWAIINTIKRVRAGKVVETVPRNELVAAATPQVFRASFVRKAYEKLTRRDATDDAEVLERIGTPVSVVLTSRWNIKITYPEDLVWAEAYLSAHPPSFLARPAAQARDFKALGL